MLTPRSLGAVSPILSTFPNSHKEEQVIFKLSWINGQNVLLSRHLKPTCILEFGLLSNYLWCRAGFLWEHRVNVHFETGGEQRRALVVTALSRPGSQGRWTLIARTSPQMSLLPGAEPVPPCGYRAPGKKSRRGRAAGQRVGDREGQETPGLKHHPASVLYGCLQPSHAYTSSLSESQCSSPDAR